MAHIAIIGSGIAGLFAASQLADAGHDVTVVTKKRPKDSSTNWAQGGVAAILDKTNVEGMESHVQDTLRSGTVPVMKPLFARSSAKPETASWTSFVSA